MARGVSSKRHAQAVFQIALENNELEKWQSDLGTMGEVLRYPQLACLLDNPKVPFDEKQKVLQKVLAGVGPLAINLAYFLVTKNRLGMLGDLITEYGHLVDAHQGREHAEVTTAVPIDEEEKRQIEKRLAEAIKKEVVVSTRVDPDVVGGLVVRIGDQLIDGSVRARLRELKRNLVGAKAP